MGNELLTQEDKLSLQELVWKNAAQEEDRQRIDPIKVEILKVLTTASEPIMRSSLENDILRMRKIRKDDEPRKEFLCNQDTGRAIYQLLQEKQVQLVPIANSKEWAVTLAK